MKSLHSPVIDHFPPLQPFVTLGNGPNPSNFTEGVVRSPGFEPGSRAWKARILVQALRFNALDDDRYQMVDEQVIKSVNPQKVDFYFDKYLQERIMPTVDRVAAKAARYVNPKPMSTIPWEASSSCLHISAE